MNPNLTPHTRNGYTRICQLAARVARPGVTVPFLLDFLGLWRGPLRPVPVWLRDAAERCESRNPTAAALLRAEARIEVTHRFALGKDVAELAANPDWARHLASWTPSEAVERHMFIRTMVSPEDPMTIVAIDLEHASLDRLLGRALLHALRGRLPNGVHGRRLLEARVRDAGQRAYACKLVLDAARSEAGDGARARGWTDVAVDIIDSYLDVLESFAQPRTHGLGLGAKTQRAVVPPSIGSSAPLM